jgi:hypothetical protein
MEFQKSKSKKGVKRAWCKKKLRNLFNVLTSSNCTRFEATSKTLQLNKAHILCSTVLIIIFTAQPASAITPLLVLGPNTSDPTVKAEKACNFLCKLALTASKFPNTKEGRTAIIWLLCSGVSKGIKVTSLMANPTFGTASIALALFCSAAYGIETVVGADTFVGADFLNHANRWCTRGYVFLAATATLPNNAIDLAIKFLEGVKGLS